MSWSAKWLLEKWMVQLWLCSSPLRKCKMEEDGRWIIPNHFQSQSEVSHVERKRIYHAGHFGWKVAVDDKQVRLEINQSSDEERKKERKREGGRDEEMPRIWRGEQAGNQQWVAKSLDSLMGCLSWGLARVGSRGTGRKMGNQKVSEVRCESISPLTLRHTRLMPYREGEKRTLWIWWENSSLKFICWSRLFSPYLLTEPLRKQLFTSVAYISKS